MPRATVRRRAGTAANPCRSIPRTHPPSHSRAVRSVDLTCRQYHWRRSRNKHSCASLQAGVQWSCGRWLLLGPCHDGVVLLDAIRVRDGSVSHPRVRPTPEGQVTITEEGGTVHTFERGDVFFVSPGTVCSNRRVGLTPIDSNHGSPHARRRSTHPAVAGNQRLRHAAMLADQIINCASRQLAQLSSFTNRYPPSQRQQRLTRHQPRSLHIGHSPPPRGHPVAHTA